MFYVTKMIETPIVFVTRNSDQPVYIYIQVGYNDRKTNGRAIIVIHTNIQRRRR